MNYITWILGFLFSFPLAKIQGISGINFSKPIDSKKEIRKQILKKSRNLRNVMKDMERKERKIIQIKEDLVPLIAKYRKM